jgi:hypothetical protein
MFKILMRTTVKSTKENSKEERDMARASNIIQISLDMKETGN